MSRHHSSSRRAKCFNAQASRNYRPLIEELENRMAPAVFTVNSNGDGNTAAGLSGTLRYCITQANLAGGNNTININNGLGQITLQSPLPQIANDVGIIGPGVNNVTISSAGPAQGGPFNIFSFALITTARTAKKGDADS